MQLFFCAFIMKKGKIEIYFCTKIRIYIDICNINIIIKSIY